MYPAYTTDTNDIVYDPMARYNKETNFVFQGYESSVTLSEKSYPPLFTSEELAKCAILLHYSLKWHFYTLLATNVVFMIISYEIIFDPDIQNVVFVILAKTICNIVLVADTLVTVFHYWNKEGVYKVTYEKIDIVLVVTQVISLLIFPFQIFKYFVTDKSILMNLMLLVVYLLRYYKLKLYIGLMQRIPGEMSLINVFGKHAIILPIIIHLLVCIWMYLGCLEGDEICNAKYDGPGSYWNDGVHAYLTGGFSRTYPTVLTPFQNYWVCLFYIMGGLTHVGYGGSSFRNYPEDLVLILTMFLSMFLVFGLKGAELSSCVIHGKTLEYEMLKRRQAMEEELSAIKHLKRNHRKRMLKYYEDFWETDKGVKTSSMLQAIPRSLFIDTQVEIFWIFINKCYFLPHTSFSFRRAIASRIKVEVLNKHDVLYELSAVCENVYYIARGNIEILSGEDGISPLITLGKGTCLGQMHLVHRTVTQFKVIVASYSVVYVLNKREFWDEVYKFRKLYQGPKIHSAYRAKIRRARFFKDKRKVASVKAVFRKWRCIVSKKILTGFKEEISKNQDEPSKLGVAAYEDPQRLYTYSKMHSQKTYDEIFLSTSFPWILQQNSQFLNIWNIFTIAVVIFVAILYPYEVAFQAKFHVLSAYMVSCIYLLDIIIQIFTAIDNKLEVIRKVEDIALIRLERIKFALDIFATLPLYLVSNISDLEGKTKRMAHILSLNKVFKIYKVDDVFRKLERNTRINIPFLRSLKNVLYLSYLGYISGCLYYIVTCFQAFDCDEDSWIQVLYSLLFNKTLPEDVKYIDDPRKHPAMFSFMNMVMVLTGTTTAFITNLKETIAMIIISVIGAVVLVSFFAGYVASVTLSNSDAVEFMEFLNVVKTYMTYTNMHDDLQMRVVRFFENIWMVNKGRALKDLYFDCPAQLYAKNQIVRYKGYLLKMDLFKDTSPQLQNIVASRCTELHLPPHEYVIYAGQTCTNCYMVIKGHCGIIEGLSIQQVVSPGDTINTMEIFAGLPSLITIRTETHCTLLKFALEDLSDVIKSYPSFSKEIHDSIDRMGVERIFSRIGEVREVPVVGAIEDKVKSFFVFPIQKRNPLNIDYKAGFTGERWKLFKYFMMRRTIMPHGRFYRNWELFRAISAVIVSLIGPTYFIHIPYFPYAQYLLYILYGLSVVDIYLKMHLCFFNSHGLLVTHPKHTAHNYMTHSFILDIFSAFPFSWLVLFLTDKRNVMVETCLHFNVILQMYRYPNAFASIKTHIYKRDRIYMTILKTLPFTLVLVNILTCILLCISGEEFYLNGHMTIIRVKYGWLDMVRRLDHLDFKEPWMFFAFTYFITLLTVLGSNFNLFRPANLEESIFLIFSVLIGYLVKLYKTVHVAHNRFILAHKLTQHRNCMVHLLKYMKDEKLPKELQHQIIEHYDYVWYINRAVTPKNIFSMLHVPLKMDVVHFSYRETLAKIPIFSEANETFYRRFGLGLNEVFTRKDAAIVKLNDIVDKVYIIHKGEALVLAPDGSVFTTLREGSMFGNLDNVAATRSMITVCSTTLIDLLVMDTQEMYKIFSNFSHIQTKLQHYLLLENLSYVIGRQDSSSSMELQEENPVNKIPRFLLLLYNVRNSTYYIVFDMIVPIICCWLASYQVAFITPFSFFYIIYILDVVHCVSTIITLITPSKDKSDQLVINRSAVLKQNLKNWRFYVDVITLPPYDLIGFALPNPLQTRRLIGIYRLLRIVKVYQGFDRSSSAFGAKVILLRLLKMSISIIFIVHVFACIWYYKACPLQKCNEATWVYNRENFTCQIAYICSIYLVVSVISSTGFRDRVPIYGLLDMIICSILVILGQYLMGSIIGDIIALVRNSNLDLAEYNFELAIFNAYLENGFVSFPFLQNMKKYCTSLWLIGHGRQIPTYLRLMPKYLLENVKMHAYGKHIYENVFFEDCHRDFLRQLITKINVEYFFLDDVICRQEDINNTMYFIHKGTVNVFSLTPSEELHVDQLSELDSFGIIQGLFPNTPHTHTYKANSVCIILYLKYEDIDPLLKFYPASKFEIYSNLNLLFPYKADTTTKARKVMIQSEDF